MVLLQIRDGLLKSTGIEQDEQKRCVHNEECTENTCFPFAFIIFYKSPTSSYGSSHSIPGGQEIHFPEKSSVIVILFAEMEQCL